MEKNNPWDFTRWNWTILSLLIVNAYYWVMVYYFGFFIPTIWTIVIASVVGIYLRLTGRV
tara:strand:+ start:387 stop:566 length:180 start_codon:yes stop_codon:yes gene_type:complete